jgi:hypothetical protein
MKRRDFLQKAQLTAKTPREKHLGFLTLPPGLKHVHTNSQWKIYGCFWKMQRYGFTAYRPYICYSLGLKSCLLPQELLR